MKHLHWEAYCAECNLNRIDHNSDMNWKTGTDVGEVAFIWWYYSFSLIKYVEMYAHTTTANICTSNSPKDMEGLETDRQAE